MHEDVISIVHGHKIASEGAHYSQAVNSGAIFWLVSFVFPSFMLTCTGLQLLVWKEHPVSVGICTQLGFFYIGFQAWRVLRAISSVPKPREDVEKGRR